MESDFSINRVISRVNLIPVDWYGHPKKLSPKKQKVKIVDINLFACKKKV